jgi:hypothetical protein
MRSMAAVASSRSTTPTPTRGGRPAGPGRFRDAIHVVLHVLRVVHAVQGNEDPWRVRMDRRHLIEDVAVERILARRHGLLPLIDEDVPGSLRLRG